MMSESRELILKFALVALIVATAFALISSREFYTNSMLASFMAVAIGSVVFIHLSIRPLGDLSKVALITAALVVIQCRVLRVVPHWPAVVCILGIASFLVLGGHSMWASGKERETAFCALIAGGLLSFSDWTASSTLGWTEAVHPKTLDLFLYKFDCSLGFQPSFLIGQWFAKYGWLHLVCILFYVALPVPLTLVFGQRLRRDGRAAMGVFWAFLVAGPAGVLLFNIFPAMGPNHVFSNFPAYPLPIGDVSRLALEPVRLPGFRNAIPSLHMTWALLAWWSARDVPRWTRAIAVLFVIFTVLATLGTGEHYLVDLVVAFPFALVLYAIFERNSSASVRRIAVTVGALTVCGWLLALTYADQIFWVSLSVPWLFVCGTLAVSLFFVHRLTLAEKSGETRLTEPQWQSIGVSAD